MSTFRAGAASVEVDPPGDLPLAGYLRTERARERLGTLQVTAAALERGANRVIVCGVDTLAIQSPEADDLRSRIAKATRVPREGILLNWSHTHHAPAGGRSIYESLVYDTEAQERAFAYIETLHDQIVEACRGACERLEPAWVRWGLGSVDAGVNRRQRDPDGQVRQGGWEPDGLVDRSVPCVQAIRPAGEAIVTLVGYGCHSVTTGLTLFGYSPDYAGPLRDVVRAFTGGECVFLQAAGGNVNPRVACDETGAEPARLGRRVALDALHALADRPGWPARLVAVRRPPPVDLRFRFEPIEEESPQLAAAEEEVDFPLLPAPSPEQIEQDLARTETRLAELGDRPADDFELRFLRFELNWLRRHQAELEAGTLQETKRGPINAIRIGDGAIVTGPGEVFTEIGMAVRERSPADVTLYAGYTSGAIGYMPTAADYARGGYEPGYAHKAYGLPAPLAPDLERILVETAVRLVHRLFPERAGPVGPEGWLATGSLPAPPPPPRYSRPPLSS